MKIIHITAGPQLKEKAQPPRSNWHTLYHKYSHIGCPAARYDDNCAHPDRCADNGRCLDLGPNPMDREPQS